MLKSLEDVTYVQLTDEGESVGIVVLDDEQALRQCLEEHFAQSFPVVPVITEKEVKYGRTTRYQIEGFSIEATQTWIYGLDTLLAEIKGEAK